MTTPLTVAIPGEATASSGTAPAGAPAPIPTPAGPRRRRWGGTGLGVGVVVLYMSLVVLIPLAAVVFRGTEGGWHTFWDQVTTPEAWSALKLTIVASAIVALINLVFGTLIAWVLVRDSFPGKSIVEVLIDLPFALPTIVAEIGRAHV